MIPLDMNILQYGHTFGCDSTTSDSTWPTPAWPFAALRLRGNASYQRIDGRAILASQGSLLSYYTFTELDWYVTLPVTSRESEIPISFWRPLLKLELVVVLVRFK